MKRVFAHIGFSMAITLFALNVFGLNFAYIVIPVLTLIFVATILIKKTRQAIAVPLSIGTAILACLLFLLFNFANYQPQASLNTKSANVKFQIVDLAEKTENGYAYTIKTSSIEIDGAPQDIKLRLKSENLIDAEAYDTVCAELTFYSIADSPMESYGYFGDNIFLSSKLYGDITVTENNNKSINFYVLKARSYIKDLVSNTLKDDYAGIVIGILIGDKSDISNQTIKNFNRIGASHLLSVSGLHTSVFGYAVYWIFKKLRLRETPSVLLTIAVLVFYSGLAGFSKSIIRASIMIGILLVAKLFKRHGDGLNSLGIATFIICLNPYAMSDVSTILTILATLSILVLRKYMFNIIVERISIKNPVLNKAMLYLINAVLITLSVLIVTFPVTYLFFGYFSIASVVSNVIIVPIGSLLLYLSSLMILFSKFGIIHYVLTYLTGLTSKILINVVYLFSKFKFATISLNDEIIAVLIFSVLIVFAVAILMNNKNAIKIASVLSVFIIVVSCVFNGVAFKNSVKLQLIRSDSGICVVAYNDDYIFASGIGSYDSYYDYYNLANFSNREFKLLVVPSYKEDDCKYANKLTLNTDVSNVLLPYNDDNVYNTVFSENVIESSDYSLAVWDDFNVRYCYTSDGYCLVLSIFDKTVIINDSSNLDNLSCDLYITNEDGLCKSNGRFVAVSADEYLGIESGNVSSTYCGDIEFTIMNDREISARRCYSWEELAN